MIKQCNAITTKNEFSLYRKSCENRDEKKKWIGKINKIIKNRLAGALSNKPLVRVYLAGHGTEYKKNNIVKMVKI